MATLPQVSLLRHRPEGLGAQPVSAPGVRLLVWHLRQARVS